MNGVGCFIAILGIIWYNAIEYQIKEERKRLQQKDTAPLLITVKDKEREPDVVDPKQDKADD